MATDEADDAGGTDWVARVPEESRRCLKKYLSGSIDARWKAILLRAFSYISTMPMSKGVESTEVKDVGVYHRPVDDDGNEVSARSSSAVLWIHGGGRIIGRAAGAAEGVNCARIVKTTGVAVLGVEYRLAPEHPFPAALDDARRAYRWLVDRLESNGSDAKIAVCGESSGGGLAAELCQRLLDESRERNGASAPLPACQGLVCPMLDDRTCVDEELCKLPPHLVWNNRSNMYGWSAYLGPDHKPGDEDVPKYVSASRREDLTGLPPAQIQVGDIDLFLKEDTDYAERLRRDGVETEFVEIKGAFHGIFTLGRDEPLGVEMWERFAAFCKKYLLE